MPINPEDMNLDDIAEALKNALEQNNIEDKNVLCIKLWKKVGPYIMFFAKNHRDLYQLKENVEDIVWILFDDFVMFKLKFYDKSKGNFLGFFKKCLNSLFSDGYLKKNRGKFNISGKNAMVEMDMDKEFRIELVKESIRKIKNKNQREVLVLRYEDYSIKEIVEITGRKESTVKSDLSRAREALEKILKEKGVKFGRTGDKRRR